MIKLKQINPDQAEIRPLVLTDLNLQKEKTDKIRYLRELSNIINNKDISGQIEKLNLKNKRLTPKRVKKVFKSILAEMIKEA